MNYIILLLGLAIIPLLFSTLKEESRSRRKKAAELLHTDFVCVKPGNIPPIHLRTTQVTIGRLRSNDICLESLDPHNKVSPTHCILWWADNHFRIAPRSTTRYKNGKLHTTHPVVYVEDNKVSVGSSHPVKYGDRISICGHIFKLVNTAPDSAPTTEFGGLVMRSKPRAAENSISKNRPVYKVMLALVALVLAVCVAVGGWFTWVESPADGDSAIGQRKDGTVSILICGTDREGERTDTIMLCQLSKEDRSLSLLSIPRDLRTTNSSGKVVRINAIYRNRGAEGMEELMDNVSMFLGYRPDGYVVFDWDLVKELVDNMGGVTVNLDHHIRVDDVYFPAGEQTLDGEMALAALRYRAGYANADIGRVAVQRIVVKACLEQWVSPEHLPKLLSQAEYVLDNAITDLTMSNVLWLGTTYLSCGSDMEMTETVIKTAPVYSNNAYKGEQAIVSELLKILNEDFNPFHGEITEEHLSITK